MCTQVMVCFQHQTLGASFASFCPFYSWSRMFLSSASLEDGLVRYCNIKTSCNGVNMWILKNSTSSLSSLDQLDVCTATSVQTFDFSTLHTSIPHYILKSRINNLVHNAFRKKDGSVRYTHIKITRAKGYFTHDINDGWDGMYTADNICKMIEFLTTFLCSLEGVFSFRWSEFQWEPIVLPYLLTFSFTNMRTNF